MGDRPGNPEVYEQIEAETDCAALRVRFNTADANHTRDLANGKTELGEVSTAYMEAIGDRTKKLGCGGSSKA